LTAAALVFGAVTMLSHLGSPSPQQVNQINTILEASDDLPIATGSGGSGSVATAVAGNGADDFTPAAPGQFASPAPSSVTTEPPLKAHEVFGFAPYWALPDESEFDLKGLTTVDYFSLGINPDGTIQQSGAGWEGYESQDFIDLIDNAHAAGDRVVITVNDFSQSSLDQLTSSETAPQELAESILFLVKAKALDGVNLDLEGEGSGDQGGLSNLVKVVSQTLKSANSDYQVTMDTYASSAGDAAGFYNIPDLSQYVDGFFVMAYQLNLQAASGDGSPLTSSMFSNQTAVFQYVNAVPASKVILGLPFFGYDWPTSNGTLDAQPDGGPSVVTYGQEVSSGHPIYWDSVTDTAWTSYQVGRQWHEAYFENPESLYMAAELAQNNGIAGVGIWALGMDGNNDQAMVSALDGNAPAKKDTLAGPSSTSTSPAAEEVAPMQLGSSGTSPTTTTVPLDPSTTGAPAASTETSTTALQSPATFTYSGDWIGAMTPVIPTAVPAGRRTLLGTMTDFTTTDPKLSCLTDGPALNVYAVLSDPAHFYVIARESVGDCANAAFDFGALPTDAPASPSTSTTTTSSTPSPS
jgi:hypothetical protein